MNKLKTFQEVRINGKTEINKYTHKQMVLENIKQQEEIKNLRALKMNKHGTRNK